MALVNWNDSYSVNVAELDKHHQKLISLINELNDAMLERRTKDVLKKIIYELSNYAVIHFATEEKYFDKFNYPDTTAHKKEHNAFVDEVISIKKDFEEGRLMLSIELMGFLKEWLIRHIQGTDKKYTKCLNDKGLF